jgi:hypothetical protein
VDKLKAKMELEREVTAQALNLQLLATCRIQRLCQRTCERPSKLTRDSTKDHTLTLLAEVKLRSSSETMMKK